MANCGFGIERGGVKNHWSKWGGKVLLHEPERCWECGEVFLSLYPITCCREHDGMEKV